MNKLFHQIKIGSLLLLAILVACKLTTKVRANSKTLAPNIKELNQQQLNDQSMMAVQWVQNSGEYQALAYQAFNVAKNAFDNAVSNGIANPTVILDIDETVLDNTPYQAGLIDSDRGFSPSTWNEWVKAAKAEAIPGAVEFVNYVNANGGKVFFISNRAESSTKDSKNNDLELATIANLKAVGITDADDSNVLLKGEFSQNIAGKVNTNKKFRRLAVQQGVADGIPRNIVLLAGDNLNDLDDKFGNTSIQRRRKVNNFSHRYGTTNATINEPTYIVIPNPMYGAWESSMYNPSAFDKDRWYELTPGEKDWQRKKLLKRWQVQ